MITSLQLWEIVSGEVNTHQGGHMKPSRNFIQWCNTVSIAIFNDLVAEYENTRQISDMLTPFLRTKNVIVTPQSGQMFDVVKLPEDYNYFANAKVIRKDGASCGCSLYDTIDGKTGQEADKAACGTYIDEDELALIEAAEDAKLTEKEITKVRSAQWTSVVEHKTLKPKFNSPKCTLYEKGLKLAPKGLGIIILDYFRKPIPATFLYTILNPGAENEYLQFDPNSKPLEWDDKMIPEFVTRLKEKYGIFTREQLISQSGAQGKKL